MPRKSGESVWNGKRAEVAKKKGIVFLLFWEGGLELCDRWKGGDCAKVYRTY